MIDQPITPNANHADVTALKGFSIKEAAGTPAAATVTLRKATISGDILAEIELAADSSPMISFGDSLASPGGVYVQVVTGTISGVLWY